MRAARLVSLSLLLLATPAGADGGPWALPAESDCRGAALPVAAGGVVTHGALAALEPFVPPELWARRDEVFHEGMRLEIGPCFRRYAPPDFFGAATARFAGTAKLRADGGLEDGPAGLPFPPDAIAADDADAGQKWAWNVERRYRGAGRRGGLRWTFLRPGRRTFAMVGDAFLAVLVGRADLAGDGYRVPWARARWVAGGEARDVETGGACAFRHVRRLDAPEHGARADEVFFRAAHSLHPEKVSWEPEEPMLACAFARGVILPRGGRVAEHRYRVAGVDDLLAPINVRRPTWPSDGARDFGPSGGSLADDRWELRRVLVLETEAGPRTIRRYVDLETLFPLYHVETGPRGSLLVQRAGRWSEDREGYPRWPDDPARPVRVLDPVVRMFWRGAALTRVEAWDTVAFPPERPPLRRLVAVEALEAGRGR